MAQLAPSPARLSAAAFFAGLLVLPLLALPQPARAEVQIKTLEDGTRIIFNESQVDRTRRRAGHLVAIPRADVKKLIDAYAQYFGLAPQLVQAVVQVESGYNIRALSSKGAMGLMQLMPGTAALLGVTDPYDPQQNIRGGTAYLRQQLDKFGDLQLALAAYNAGPGAVERHGGIPPYAETQAYVTKIMSLVHGAPPPELLRHTVADQAQIRRDVTLRREALQQKLAPPAASRIEFKRGSDNILMLTNVPAERPGPKANAKTAATKPGAAKPVSNSPRPAPPKATLPPNAAKTSAPSAPSSPSAKSASSAPSASNASSPAVTAAKTPQAPPAPANQP